MSGTEPFQRRVLAAIRSFPRKTLTEKEFERLALATFRRQLSLNAPYTRFAAARGAVLVERWRDIPALPVSAFKAARVACFPQAAAVRTFRTSGTTRHERGEHAFRTLEYYDTAIASLFRAGTVPDRGGFSFFMLVPPSRERPDSSLSHMAARCAALFGAGARYEALRGGEMRFDELARRLERAARRPVLIFSTTLALGGFLEYLATRGLRFKLPAGSRIMETGGAKGRKKTVSRGRLLELAQQRLGIRPARVVNEYGMTELSSQFYGSGPQAWKAAPPWTRVAVLHPETGRLKSRGKGLLRIWDLANQDSCAVIQTEDLAEIGPRGFRILGRLAGADLRGCSLTFEELERLA